RGVLGSDCTNGHGSQRGRYAREVCEEITEGPAIAVTSLLGDACCRRIDVLPPERVTELVPDHGEMRYRNHIDRHARGARLPRMATDRHRGDIQAFRPVDMGYLMRRGSKVR